MSATDPSLNGHHAKWRGRAEVRDWFGGDCRMQSGVGEVGAKADFPTVSMPVFRMGVGNGHAITKSVTCSAEVATPISIT